MHPHSVFDWSVHKPVSSELLEVAVGELALMFPNSRNPDGVFDASYGVVIVRCH